MDINTLHKSLFDNYTKYCQQGFEQRYFPHSILKNHLQAAISNKVIKMELLGQSFESRDIFKLNAGNGKVKILLWSQMHGDESTATRALLDVINFLQTENDEFNAVRQLILQNLDLCFVPMLNPDGAERWQRRNAQSIDMNRDAVKSVTTEGSLLQTLFKSITPDYAFNLHDQASYYTAGNTEHPATISLLAPPVDDNDTVTENRQRSMQLVCLYNSILQNYIPNCVGKWKDDYEPRAFGEHFQSLGAATILIESGGRANDIERNLARKLNFVMLITGLYAIATGELLKQNTVSYKQIPVNVKENVFDVIYKNATINSGNKVFISDIGVRRTEKLNKSKKQLKPTFIIDDIGDLSPFGAFEIIDCTNKQVKSQSEILVGNPVNFTVD